MRESFPGAAESAAKHKGKDLMGIYLDTERYTALVEALTRIKPCPLTGDTADAIKIALGEHGDIWPATIIADAVEHHQVEAGAVVA